MILGRPTNLWLGLVASIVGLSTVMALAAGVDPVLVANMAGGGTAVLGAIIALVAYQPPTLSPGDQFHVQTPEGVPNYTTTVATPPASDPPPVPTP